MKSLLSPTGSVLRHIHARRVKTTGKTGVEMEALTAVAAAGLTIYDMCKAVDRAMTVTDVRLLKRPAARAEPLSRNETS